MRQHAVAPELVIRPRLVGRVGEVVVGAPLAVYVILTLPDVLGRHAYSALAVYGLLVGAWIFNSTWWLSRVVVRDDELHVRNWIRDEVFTRDEVLGFASVEMSGAPRGTRRRGAVAQIAVTVVGPRTILMNASVRGPIDTTSVDSWLTDLQKWLQTEQGA